MESVYLLCFNFNFTQATELINRVKKKARFKLLSKICIHVKQNWYHKPNSPFQTSPQLSISIALKFSLKKLLLLLGDFKIVDGFF